MISNYRKHARAHKSSDRKSCFVAFVFGELLPVAHCQERTHALASSRCYLLMELYTYCSVNSHVCVCSRTCACVWVCAVSEKRANTTQVPKSRLRYVCLLFVRYFSSSSSSSSEEVIFSGRKTPLSCPPLASLTIPVHTSTAAAVTANRRCLS